MHLPDLRELLCRNCERFLKRIRFAGLHRFDHKRSVEVVAGAIKTVLTPE